MRKTLICFLIFIAFLGSSCTSSDEKEVKTTQTKITSVHPTDKQIGIKVDDKYLKLHIKEDTKIVERGKNISFFDLDVGDKVDISYVKKGGFLGFGGTYLAKIIRVLDISLIPFLKKGVL